MHLDPGSNDFAGHIIERFVYEHAPVISNSGAASEIQEIRDSPLQCCTNRNATPRERPQEVRRR
jgi:hypothetical protein